MKFLGIDYGTKRIGLALSDEDGKLAFPKETLKNDGDALNIVVDLIKGIHLIMFKAGCGRASTTTICNLFGTLIEKDIEN